VEPSVPAGLVVDLPRYVYRGGHDLRWAGDRTGWIDIDNLTVTTR